MPRLAPNRKWSREQGGSGPPVSVASCARARPGAGQRNVAATYTVCDASAIDNLQVSHSVDATPNAREPTDHQFFSCQRVVPAKLIDQAF